MITGLYSLKGIDFLMEAPEDSKDQSMVVLGEGDSKYEKFFSELAKANLDRFAVALTFDDAVAHQVITGSDISLMPSIYEPSGLDDSIQPFDGKMGTCFKFAPYDRKLLQQVFQNSMVWFADKPGWDSLINNGMDMDFSWDIAAQQYSSLSRDIQPNH